MSFLAHILAATDFSVPAERAVARAVRLALEHDARVSLVHVVAGSRLENLGAQLAASLGVEPVTRDAVLTDATERLGRRAEELARQRGIRCEAVAVHGRPAAELARLAEDADLTVVGVRGASSGSRAFAGTTALSLLQRSPGPVLAVRRAPAAPYRYVLAPTDFSAQARGALRGVSRLLPKARLHVAHAFELPYEGLMRHATVQDGTIARYTAAVRKRLLDELAAWTEACGVDSARASLHVEHGYPPAAIEHWINSLGMDLVAIAPGAHTPIERALLGSVSAHTIQAARCDVLLARGSWLT